MLATRCDYQHWKHCCWKLTGIQKNCRWVLSVVLDKMALVVISKAVNTSIGLVILEELTQDYSQGQYTTSTSVTSVVCFLCCWCWLWLSMQEILPLTAISNVRKTGADSPTYTYFPLPSPFFVYYIIWFLKGTLGIDNIIAPLTGISQAIVSEPGPDDIRQPSILSLANNASLPS